MRLPRAISWLCVLTAPNHISFSEFGKFYPFAVNPRSIAAIGIVQMSPCSAMSRPNAFGVRSGGRRNRRPIASTTGQCRMQRKVFLSGSVNDRLARVTVHCWARNAPTNPKLQHRGSQLPRPGDRGTNGTALGQSLALPTMNKVENRTRIASATEAPASPG